MKRTWFWRLQNERQEIVTSATGTPLPEAQVSAAINAQNIREFRNRVDLTDPLRHSSPTR